MYGQIQSIEEVHDFNIQPIAPHADSGSRLGFSQLLNTLADFQSMDGYKVTTDQTTFLVLIDNNQSCCESWGYMSTDDDLSYYVGSVLLRVEITDTGRIKEDVMKREFPYGLDEGEIQFVDFVTDRGAFQLAVYNAHNGYYGHGILVAKDQEILLNSVL